MFAGSSMSLQLPARSAMPARSQPPLAQHTLRIISAQRMHGGKAIGAAATMQPAPSSMGGSMRTQSSSFSMPLTASKRGTATAAAAAPDHSPDKHPATAAQQQQATDILTGLGLSRITAAWILQRVPDVACLKSGELQKRIDALQAAFGVPSNGSYEIMSAAELGKRLAAVPKLLTLRVDVIAGMHARLADFGLTADEAAAALAAEPAIMLISREQLRSMVESLQMAFQLSPKQLRDVVIEMPLCLRRRHGHSEVPSETRKKLKRRDS